MFSPTVHKNSASKYKPDILNGRNRPYLKFQEHAKTEISQDEVEMNSASFFQSPKSRRLEDLSSYYLSKDLLSFEIFSAKNLKNIISQNEIEKILFETETKSFKKDSYIYKQGQKCNGELYLILSGEILLETPLKNNFFFQKDYKIPKKRNVISRENNMTANFIENNSKQIRLKEPNQKQLSLVDDFENFDQPSAIHSSSSNNKFGHILSRGNHFGISSLINQPSREETAKVHKNVQLLVLKDNSLEILRRLIKSNPLKKITIPSRRISTVEKNENFLMDDAVLKSFEIKNYTKGTMVCSEGEKDDYIYLALTGAFQISKKRNLTENQIQKNPNGYSSFHRILRQNFDETIVLEEISKGSIFGEESLFNGSGLYDYSVKVSSNDTSAYVIDKKKLKFRISSINLSIIKEHYFKKKETYQDILENKKFDRHTKSQIPPINYNEPNHTKKLNLILPKLDYSEVNGKSLLEDETPKYTFHHEPSKIISRHKSFSKGAVNYVKRNKSLDFDLNFPRISLHSVLGDEDTTTLNDKSIVNNSSNKNSSLKNHKSQVLEIWEPHVLKFRPKNPIRKFRLP